MSKRPGKLVLWSWLLIPTLLAMAGCGGQMSRQPRYEPLEMSRFFADGQSARPPVPGTVARGQAREDAHFYAGIVDGQLATTFPFPVTLEVLERGQERYNISCTPCHGLTGAGDGMIVQRGFSPPPTFHQDRLRNAPVGHYYNVITDGFGAMYSYGYQIEPADRWAIIAYIRALQRSQRAPLDTLSPEERAQLDGAVPVSVGP